MMTWSLDNVILKKNEIDDMLDKMDNLEEIEFNYQNKFMIKGLFRLRKMYNAKKLDNDYMFIERLEIEKINIKEINMSKLVRKHESRKDCIECNEFDRTKYIDKYPKKCKCGGFIHHELECRGWDRTSFSWSSHIIKCDKCNTIMRFDIDIGWEWEDDYDNYELQYFKALKRFKEKRDKY